VDGEEPVERLRVEELHPGPRQLGAHEQREHAAGEEEEDRRDEVLDPDHLVIGVHAEVVLPRVRAVPGVILGLRRLSERVVRPVVERADAGEKPSGAATSAETRTTTWVSRIGCQSANQRSSTTMPKPIAPKSTVIHAARIQPAPRSNRRALLLVGGAGVWL
jgi:hypothetical protein